MSLRLILDTDIGGDCDDALALALAMRHPEIDLHAVTTVSGDTSVRAHLAARLLAMAGLDGVEVAAGVSVPSDAPNWNGHEGEGVPLGPEVPLSDRGAIDALCDVPPDTVVATIGMQSNVAAAVDRDPALVERTALLAVMGGAFAPIVSLDGTEHPPDRDWNLLCDPAGAVRSLNAGFNALYVPVDVTFRVPLRQRHLDRLRGGDELCHTLATLVDVWHERWFAPFAEHAPGDLSDVVAFLHDPLTVGCLVERSFVSTETLPVYVELRDGVPRTLVDPERGRDAEVVRSVDADAFAEWWLDILLSK